MLYTAIFSQYSNTIAQRDVVAATLATRSASPRTERTKESEDGVSRQDGCTGSAADRVRDLAGIRWRPIARRNEGLRPSRPRRHRQARPFRRRAVTSRNLHDGP